jgi:hypothetical protein
MCNGNTLQRWQSESIKLLINSGAECKLLIIDDNDFEKKTLTEKIKKYFTKTGLYLLYQRFFFCPEAKKEITLKDIIPYPVKSIKCKTHRKKYSEYFNKEDINAIRHENLDFILRYGFNIIRGDILKSAKYGIWSFHHDDEQKYRGGPPGFWEIMKNDFVTGSILQRLTDKLDSGIILKKGFFKTVNHSYKGQLDYLYLNTAKWPVLICNEISNGNITLFNDEPSKTNAEIYKAPPNTIMLKFVFKLFVNKIKFHYQELFKPEEWNIAVAEIDDNGFKKPKWHNQPKRGKFYADPFGFEYNNKIHILFENYNYSTRKGVISQTVFSNNKFSKIKSVLEEDFHLSYPYIFKYNDEIFCIPETVAANQIRLYKFDKKNEKLIFEKVLIPDFAGVDPTIVKFNGKWWLFTTLKECSNTELFIFFSDNLFSDFLPHHSNPVKIDIKSSRPGGVPIIKNNILFRISQNSSETYGQNIIINKITELSENKFKEELVNTIMPDKLSTYNKGLHTYSQAGKLIIMDGKRFRFNKHNFYYMLKRKLHL